MVLVRALVVVLALVGSACSGSDTSVCANGAVCPRGLLCDSVSGGCVAPEQLSACEGASDGNACEFLGTMGICDRGVCLDSQCGDGIRAQGEACDDGNNLDGDGCSADCRSSEVCGNGIVDTELGEECDCGGDELSDDCEQLNSDLAGASCRSDCLAHCGDGIVNAAEDCDSAAPAGSCLDFGFSRGGLGCSSGCGVLLDGCRHFGLITTDGPGISTADIADMWAAPSGELFAVGNRTAAIRNVSGNWKVYDLAGNADAQAVHGLSATDVIVVGQAEATPPLAGLAAYIARFDGSRWAPITPPSVTLGQHAYWDVWMGASDDIVVVGELAGLAMGDRGRLWSYDGSWVTSTLAEEMRSVDGQGSLVVAVGFAGQTVVRKNGEWGDLYVIPGAPNLRSVWVADESNAYAVGNAGTVYHYDGNTWTAMTPPVSESFRHIVGRGPGDFFVFSTIGTVLHYDGRSWWTMSEAGATPPRAGVFHDGRLELGGNAFLTFELVEGAYEHIRLPGLSSGLQELDVAGNGVWLAQEKQIHRLQNSVLAEVDSVVGAQYTDFDAISGDVAFYSRLAEICRVEAGVGKSCDSPNAGLVIARLAVLPDETTFATTLSGQRLIAGKPGNWSELVVSFEKPDDEFTDVDAADGRGFAISLKGEVWIYEEGQWNLETRLAADSLRTIWALDRDNIFVGGDDGALWRKTSGGWVSYDLGEQRISAIAGNSASDIVAVSPNNLHHFDGEQWTRVKAPNKLMHDADVTAGALYFLVDDQRLVRLERPTPW